MGSCINRTFENWKCKNLQSPQECKNLKKNEKWEVASIECLKTENAKTCKVHKNVKIRITEKWEVASIKLLKTENTKACKVHKNVKCKNLKKRNREMCKKKPLNLNASFHMRKTLRPKPTSKTLRHYES